MGNKNMVADALIFNSVIMGSLSFLFIIDSPLVLDSLSLLN